jgi:hypothetical protein
MDVLSKLGEMVVAALAVEGTLAIAKRLALVGGRVFATGDAFVAMVTLGLAQAGQKAVTEYAGSYLGDWEELSGWVVFALVWIVTFRLLREVASRVGLRKNAEAS